MILTASQIAALALACQLGTPHDLCETAQAIVMVESSACLPGHKVGKHGELGCSQIKPLTAAAYGYTISDDELRDNDTLNMQIMVAILVECRRKNGTWRKMLVCYHEGASGDSLDQTQDELEHHIYVAKINLNILEQRRRKAHASKSKAS